MYIEPELLISLYWGNQYSQNQIGQLLECKRDTIRYWMDKYNIEKRTNIDGSKLNPSIDTQFKVGQQPWNKGTSGVMIAWNKNKSNPHKESCKCPICSHKRGEIINRPWLGKERVSMRGENNINWKGGITSENEKVRKSTSLKDWKIAVIKRDNYICQICGQRGEELHIHHIKVFAKYPEERFNVDNGITLCRDCHVDLHHQNNQLK